MERWWDKIKTFNDEWNDLPRRLFLIVVLMCCLWLIVQVFPYVAPAVLALLFSWMIEPVIRLVMKGFKNGKLIRKISAAILVVLLLGVLFIVLFMLTGRIVEEIKSLATVLPGWIKTASSDLFAWIDSLPLEGIFAESGLDELLLGLLSELTSMLSTLATRAASTVASGAWRVVSLMPEILLFIVVTLMGTFYLSADRELIFGFVNRWIPDKFRNRAHMFRVNILRAIFTQLRAAMVMLVINFIELTIGFTIMGLDYAILFALVIAVLDALPAIGAGLFLIPMMIYGIIAGSTTYALGGGLLYLLIVFVRQFVEPRIIGKQFGLHPLATMMAMYAGLQIMGFAGLLLGPLVLLLCKITLTADAGEEAAPSPKPSMWKRFKRDKKS